MGSDIERLRDQPELDEAQARTVATYTRTLVDVVKSRRGNGNGPERPFEELVAEAMRIPALREELKRHGIAE
jgi:hypothetical protein